MESVQGLLLAMIIVAFGTTTHLIQAQPDPNGTLLTNILLLNVLKFRLTFGYFIDLT